MYMSIDYITKGRKRQIVIDENYVEKIVKRRFSGIVDLLKEHHSSLSDEAIQSYVKSLDSAFDEEKASAENQTIVMNELSEQTARIMRYRKLKEYIVSRALEYEDFDERIVEQIIDNFAADGSFEGCSDIMCLRKVLEKLINLDSQDTSQNEGEEANNRNKASTESTNAGKKDATFKKTEAEKERDKARDKETTDWFREEIKKRMPHNPFDSNP